MGGGGHEPREGDGVNARGRRSGVAPAAMLAAAGVAALGPLGVTTLAPMRAAASEVYVAVVVDFAGASGAPANVVQCVQVPATSTDAQALAQAVNQQTTYNASGLLCAIAGYPPTGDATCTRASGQDYYFWSYWHGSTGSWVYASDGPAEQPVSDGDVEGWRYEDPGPASPSAAKPSVAPDYAAICPQATSATTTSAPPSAVAAGSPAATVPPTPASGAPATTTLPPGAPPPTVASAAKAGESGGSAGVTTPTGVSPGAPPTTTGAPAATTSTTGVGKPRAGPRRDRLAAGVLGRRAHNGSGTWPLVGTAIALGALGAGAALIWRRRSVVP